MKKILLFNSISLLVGIFIGHWYTQSSDTSLDAVAFQNKNISQLEEEKKQKAGTLENVQARKETSDMKKKNYKFFKQENNYKGNVELLLNKVGQLDHRIENGEANMEIIDLYEEILNLDPKNTMALNRYSNYMIMLGRYDEAKSLINKCLEVMPTHPSCLGNSTIYALHGGNRLEIDKMIDTCLQKSPSNVQCLHNKGNSFLSKGDGRKSLKYFKMLELANGNDDIHFSKGTILFSFAQSYETMNDLKNAKKYYNESCVEGMEYACQKVKNSKFSSL